MAAGAAIELGEATRIEPRDGDWALLTDSRELVAGAVLVATGTRPRELGVPGEGRLEGRGLSHCASCDGPLYRGKVVAVYGEGDHALVEALELVRHDVGVVLVNPGQALGGQDTYRRRIAESGQIEVRHGSVIEEILGDGAVDGVRVRDLASGESSTVPVEGVFAYAGRVPNTHLLEGLVVLDDAGSVPVDAWMQTELPGLFAAGDVRAGAVGQAIAAAGDGATAAVAAHRYLADRAR